MALDLRDINPEIQLLKMVQNPKLTLSTKDMIKKS